MERSQCETRAATAAAMVSGASMASALCIWRLRGPAASRGLNGGRAGTRTRTRGRPSAECGSYAAIESFASTVGLTRRARCTDILSMLASACGGPRVCWGCDAPQPEAERDSDVARQELPHQAHCRAAPVKRAHLHEAVRHSFHHVQLVRAGNGLQCLAQRQ